MMAVDGFAPAAPMTYLIGCDARDNTRVFSGSTYHLALEASRSGLITKMINLYPRGIAAWHSYARAGLWKLRGGLRGRQGFKFTDAFLDGAWQRGLPALRGATVINNFQLFGSYFLNRYEKLGIVPYCYIDATLSEYFDNYAQFDTARIDDGAKREALAVERAGYGCCPKIFVMSRRAAACIADHYGVPQGRIHRVPPGANVPESALAAFERDGRHSAQSRKAALVVGFVGFYPERKGLPVIADAVRLARRAGYDIRLNVIGRCPAEIAQRDGVLYFGPIDKSVDIDRFVKIVRDSDIGCMLSHAETAGIALLEFLRLGVPVIGTDVGGIPDIIELGAGEVVSPAVSADVLAQCFARLLDAPDHLAELREQAWCRRDNASWRRAVRDLKGVLGA
jgi:glycosyltransferase involved in cell wall biosynthesis